MCRKVSIKTSCHYIYTVIALQSFSALPSYHEEKSLFSILPEIGIEQSLVDEQLYINICIRMNASLSHPLSYLLPCFGPRRKIHYLNS